MHRSAEARGKAGRGVGAGGCGTGGGVAGADAAFYIKSINHPKTKHGGCRVSSINMSMHIEKSSRLNRILLCHTLTY